MTTTNTRSSYGAPADLVAGEITDGMFRRAFAATGRGVPVTGVHEILHLAWMSPRPVTASILVHDKAFRRAPVMNGWSAGPDASGWQSYVLDANPKTVVHLGHVADLDPVRHPYARPGGSDVLQSWAMSLGVAYHGTPGVAGTDVLRAAAGSHRVEIIYRPDRRRDWSPTLERLARDGLERDFVPTDWAGGQHDGPTITLDANMAYLAAAITADLPTGTLRQRGAGDPPAGESGYHLVDLAGWWSSHLPDPAGYRAGNTRRSGDYRVFNGSAARWITTPTLRLIRELQADGVHGGATVLESWTAPARRITRPWGELIRDVIALESSRPSGPRSAAMVRLLKAAYRETIGLMGRPGGRVYRPDWQSIIVAQSRCTLWRKLHAAWKHGAVPLSVNVDAVTFAGTQPPASWRIETGLGAFKIKDGAA